MRSWVWLVWLAGCGTEEPATCAEACSTQLAALQLQIDTLTTALGALETRVTTAENGLAVAEGEIRVLQNQVDAVGGEITTLQQVDTAHAAAIEALQGEVHTIGTTYLTPEDLVPYATSAYVDHADAGLQSQINHHQTRIFALEGRADPTEFLAYVQVTPATHSVAFVGANVYVQNGTGATDAVNGLGNLIVGYDENTGGVARGGSHNVVIGLDHGYVGYGGLVAGEANQVGDANVAFGYGNVATGSGATVLGGAENEAVGAHASVAGGNRNVATGEYSTILAGYLNATYGTYSAIVGGGENETTNFNDSSTVVVGGRSNRAVYDYTVVLGGREYAPSVAYDIAPNDG